MSGLYVASNPTAMTVQFKLARSMGSLSETLTRLSTGLKINSGKDDPAGLIASELLKSDITGTSKAITNTERANSLLSVADGALGQIGNLLNDVRGLVVESANTGTMSASQIEANQLQIDASIDAIDRITRTTTYQGQKLLDGSLDFSTGCLDSTTFESLKIHSANFGTASAVNVNINVQEAARQAQLEYRGTGVSQNTTFDITGSVGTKSFSFGAGTTNQEMAAAISALSDSTGVTASVEGGSVRGSTVLSSTGRDNDIVITANEAGYEAGNYTFRIVHGATNDVSIVSDPALGKPGVVEISLTESHELVINGVGGLFDVTIDTDFAGENAATQATSVHLTRGTSNASQFFEADSAALAQTDDGRSVTFGSVTEGYVSAVNGWTLQVDDGAAAPEIDLDAKTIRLAAADATEDGIAEALATATGTVGEATLIGELVHGDRLTFTGGGDAGQLYVTYKEGATVGEIQDLINRTPNVQATLTSGTSRNNLVPALPEGKTYLEGSGNNPASRYQSGVTAQTVIDLINSKLGDKFTASALSGDGTGGRISYMNAAADYGDVNLDNALRFSGTDSSPIVRLVTGGANRELGVSLHYLSESDIDSGLTRPVLEIQLATDASGNSTSTALDIAELFDRLTPEETGGISAELLYPAGIDPNGRAWSVDACGNVVVQESCPPAYGNGIVQPTGEPGPCEIQQNDLVLLGRNQKIEEGGYPVARIASASAVSGVSAVAVNSSESVTLDFGPTSALNGVSFSFTTVQTKAGFDSSTGRLNVYLDPATVLQTDPELTESLTGTINGALMQNWSAIAGYTKSVGDPPKLQEITGADEIPGLVDSMAEDAVLVIGGVTGGGGVPAPATATATLGYDTGGPDEAFVQYDLTTESDTDALNGVKIVFSNGVAQHEYNSSTKVLTVKIDDVTFNDTSWLAIRMKEEIDDAIALFFTPAVTVSVDFDDSVFIGDDIPIGDVTAPGFTFTFKDGSSGGDPVESPGGVGTDDPALRLVSREKGTYFSGVNVAFVENGKLPAGSIEVAYDENNRTMIVTGNTGGAGVMDTDVLAGLMNGNATFRKYCDEIDLDRDVTPDTTIAFNSTGAASGQFVGGYKIVTEGDDGTTSGTGFATSIGVGMTGMSDAEERLVLRSVEAGSEHFVRVHVAEGSFDTYDERNRKSCEDDGEDMSATVNGLTARARGNRLDINTADLSLSATVANRVGKSSFTINGGGALFQLGSNVVSTQQIRISLGNMSSTHLGGSSGMLYQLKSGGVADMNSDTRLADRIVNEAIQSVATTRGRIGAIQRSTLEPNIDALQDGLISLTAAESMISNADFAEESSNMLRQQILIQAASSVLAQANQLPQYAASLVQ